MLFKCVCSVNRSKWIMSEQPKTLAQKPREISPEVPVQMISPASMMDSIELMESIAREDRPAQCVQLRLIAR